jgi:hypothetical protein
MGNGSMLSPTELNILIIVSSVNYSSINVNKPSISNL